MIITNIYHSMYIVEMVHLLEFFLIHMYFNYSLNMNKDWRTVCSNKFIGAPIGPTMLQFEK